MLRGLAKLKKIRKIKIIVFQSKMALDPPNHFQSYLDVGIFLTLQHHLVNPLILFLRCFFCINNNIFHHLKLEIVLAI